MKIVEENDFVLSEVPEHLKELWNSLVVKSNQIIESVRDNCNATELKIINILISKMKPGSKYTNGKLIPITFKEFKALLNTRSNNSDWFRETCQNMFDKSFWVKDKNLQTETVYHYFRRIQIDYGIEEILFDFDEYVLPFIAELKRDFTRYPLQFTLLMKSKYSIKLYEMIKDIMKGSGKKIFAVYTEDLREALNVPETMRFNDFKKLVLEPACCEINSNEQLGIYQDINNLNELKEIESVRSGEINVFSDLIVSYRATKRYSRNYNVIEFHVEEKPKQMIVEQRRVNEEYLADEIKKPTSFYHRSNKASYQSMLEVLERTDEEKIDE